MSLRKMLKVSLLMLLAMALAATSVQAHLDLFNQRLTSMNQPNLNSGVLQVLVKGNGKSNVDDEPFGGAIPYTECINTCENCWCTLKWPPESNICICGDNIKSKNPAAAVKQVESSSSKVKSDCGKNTASNSKKPAIHYLGDDKKEVLWTKVKSDRIPYYECIETCESCTCDRRVPEAAMCICNDPKAPDLIPYYECIETCESCACDKRPPEYAMCICNGPKAPDLIPYYECIETCKSCTCDRRVPEAAMCICNDPKTPKPSQSS